MSDTKYSLTTLLGNLTAMQTNSYQIISKLSDVMNSSDDSVSINVIDPTDSGIIKSVNVPSFGSLKTKLTKLENDINNLSNVNENTSTSVQLADGSFRSLLIKNFKEEAADIKSLNTPSAFNTKENWFFESFLNPLLYINFDLTGQIKPHTEKIEVSRFILSINDTLKINTWESLLNNKSNISYSSFLDICSKNNISYYTDKFTVDLPPNNLAYNGKFSVISINSNASYNVTSDNITYTRRALSLTLDSVLYNDINKNYGKTEELKIGDFLTLGNDTRYKIVEIKPDENSVLVELIEGFRSIAIGSELSYYNETLIKTTAQINIGFNEYCVIFIKAIDPDSKLLAANWSPGVGIYTSNLVMNDGTQTLESYYQKEVVDFGAYLYASIKDKTIPSIHGIKPNVPTLDLNNFKVVPINEHLTNDNNIKKIIELNSELIKVKTQLVALDSAISKFRNNLQTVKYPAEAARIGEQNALKYKISERASTTTLYNSIITDINTMAANNSIDNLTQKYRLRGFFPFPEPKISSSTSTQEVIQFKIQYRYVKKDGSANKPVQMEFLDNDGSKLTGTFSSWINYLTPLRDRMINPSDGVAYWITENVESAEIVNINQIDIPIQEGEGIEFRIKSISEAGWPITPIESEWSDILRVDFPAEFESLPDANSIIQQTKKEAVKIELNSELVTMQLDKVASSIINQNGKFFISAASNIASGFLTPENNIISLFDKILSIEKELNSIKTLITKAKGKLTVSIIDENGNEMRVENNTTVKIFAGNYRDQVSTLSNPKGAIITKQYFIKIINESASDLELYSRIWGSNIVKCNNSYDPNAVGQDKYLNNDDYNRNRKYDRVPIGLSDPDLTDVEDHNFIRQFPQQSAQVQGQFINSRFSSYNGTLDLYTGSTAVDNNEYSTPGLTGASGMYFNFPGVPGDFIWSGLDRTPDVLKSTVITNDPGGTYIYMHIDHPQIAELKYQKALLSNATTTLEKETALTQLTSNVTRVSKYANLSTFAPDGKKQTVFNTVKRIKPTLESLVNESDYNSKIGFNSEDQYLIGTKSCGSYLFLNPNRHSDIVVNGSNSLSNKIISFGYENAITIPFVFQYRMTDYFGFGNSGKGNVLGDYRSTSSTNTEYAKILGIDIYSNPIDLDRFTFDILINARYYSSTLTPSEIPNRTFSNAIDTLTKTIKYTTPSTSK